MEVAAIEGVYSVTSVDALIAVLANRVGDAVNSFWLSRQSEGFPALAIMVNGDFACVNYLPDGDTAGYVSVGHLTGLEARDTSFTISMSGEQMEVEELGGPLFRRGGGRTGILRHEQASAVP